jgi:hypothetical protein
VNRVLRRISGLKMSEVRGWWRKLNKKKLHDLYSSSSIIRTIKSRRISRPGRIARMGEKMNTCKLLVGKHRSD